ncbi:AAEL011185-PA [Aedes aegypti]|uniref:AAEL011185-PA n=1 Tax=Aedes aegypti TaxID=7159 RepID=Q16QS7_AEDAE|nr:AAEL011185-PA [Aedes aegypti]
MLDSNGQTGKSKPEPDRRSRRQFSPGSTAALLRWIVLHLRTTDKNIRLILLWAKPDIDTCRSPYEWACGRFEEKYIAHSLFGVNKGEWNFDANRDYAETTAAYEFISKLPSVAMTFSTQAMLKKLHSICTTVETVSSNEVITSLKRALNDLGEYKTLRFESF